MCAPVIESFVLLFHVFLFWSFPLFPENTILISLVWNRLYNIRLTFITIVFNTAQRIIRFFFLNEHSYLRPTEFFSNYPNFLLLKKEIDGVKIRIYRWNWNICGKFFKLITLFQNIYVKLQENIIENMN